MPEADYVWLPREDILTSRRSRRSSTSSRDLGVDRVRLTGGEPLLRRDLPDARRRCWPRRPAIRDLAMTTNGVLLAPTGRGAARAPGSHRITVSLDTLRPRALPRADALRRASTRVLDGHRRRGRAPASPRLKIDTVVIRGVNDDELVACIEFGRTRGRRGALHRVHGRRRRDALVDASASCRAREMLERARRALRRRSRRIDETCVGAGRALPRCPTARSFGIISSTTAAVLPRLRPQPADGGRPVVPVPLRARGHSTCAARCAPARRRERAAAADRAAWARARRPRRRRAARRSRDRAPLDPGRARCSSDPHLEMHTRGGWHSQSTVGSHQSAVLSRPSESSVTIVSRANSNDRSVHPTPTDDCD